MKIFVRSLIFKMLFTFISISVVNISHGQESEKGILPQSDFLTNRDVSVASKNFQTLGFKQGKDLTDGTLRFKSPSNSKEKVDLTCETIRLINAKGEEVYITRISDKIRKESIIITEQGNNINIVENGQMKQISGNAVARSACNSYLQAASQPCKRLISCINANKANCKNKKGTWRKIWCYTTSCTGSAVGCIGNIVQFIACIVANG